MNDFILTNHGSIYLLEPVTEAAREWVAVHLDGNEHLLYVGDAIVIEPRYVKQIVRGFQQDGLVLQHD
jgi:hypothetical protein